jgi:putative transcriptional regulator
MVGSLAGQLLVASPSQSGSVFGRGVCLVLRHGEQGAFGVLLNRPLQLQPKPLWDLLMAGKRGAFAKSATPPVLFGGPLHGPVLALHAQPQWSELQANNGIFMAAQRDHIQQLVEQRQGPVRLIIGHAAWRAGQLEAELAQGWWYVMPAHPSIVFGGDEMMWPACLRKAAGLTLARWVGAKQLPANPLMN